MIPACATLVVDEAHQIEDVATQYFGVAVSNSRADDLVRDGERLLATSSFEPKQAEALARALTRVSTFSHGFFTGLSLARNANTEARARYTTDTLGELAEDGMALIGALDRLEATLALAMPRRLV